MDPALRARACVRLGLFPFDPALKLMTTVDRNGTGVWAHTKGAPEEVIARSTQLLGPDGKARPLGVAECEQIRLQVNAYATRGLRVLAVARRSACSSLFGLRGAARRIRRNVPRVFVNVGSRRLEPKTATSSCWIPQRPSRASGCSATGSRAPSSTRARTPRTCARASGRSGPASIAVTPRPELRETRSGSARRCRWHAASAAGDSGRGKGDSK